MTVLTIINIPFFNSSRDCMPPPPPPCLHLCRRSQCEQPLSYTTATVSHIVREIVQRSAATDAPSFLPHIVAAILPPAHPERPNAHRILQSAQRCQAPRKHLRPTRPRAAT